MKNDQKAVRTVKIEKNDVVIMDDGLQDVSIKKDLKIICFNSIDLAGNGFLLPAGPLREKLNSYIPPKEWKKDEGGG